MQHRFDCDGIPTKHEAQRREEKRMCIRHANAHQNSQQKSLLTQNVPVWPVEGRGESDTVVRQKEKKKESRFGEGICQEGDDVPYPTQCGIRPLFFLLANDDLDSFLDVFLLFSPTHTNTARKRERERESCIFLFLRVRVICFAEPGSKVRLAKDRFFSLFRLLEPG